MPRPRGWIDFTAPADPPMFVLDEMSKQDMRRGMAGQTYYGVFLAANNLDHTDWGEKDGCMVVIAGYPHVGQVPFETRSGDAFGSHSEVSTHLYRRHPSSVSIGDAVLGRACGFSVRKLSSGRYQVTGRSSQNQSVFTNIPDELETVGDNAGRMIEGREMPADWVRAVEAYFNQVVP